MQSRNSQGVLAAFSRTTPWRDVQCDPVNGSPVHQETVTYTQMARDFKPRKGWYEFFLVNRNYGCPIIQDFRPGLKWHRQGTTFVRHPDNPTALYLKWRQEGGKWVIAEIGYTGD